MQARISFDRGGKGTGLKVGNLWCSERPSILLMAEALTPGYCHPDLSYERLETLGDSFLKYEICVHVFHAYPNAHEGEEAPN